MPEPQPHAGPLAESVQTALQGGVQYRHFKSTLDGDVLILTLTTPQLLDDVVEEGLFQELLLAVEACRGCKVAVDLHQVKAASSAALRPLAALHRALRERGGRLVICGLSPFVAEVIHLAEVVHDDGRSGPLEERRTLAEAVAALRRV